MILKLLFTSIILFQTFSSVSFAYSSSDVALVGTVKSLDEKNIKISSGNTVYTVPRKLSLLSEIKPGQNISIDLTKDQFVSLKKIVEKKK